ncbi:hypothetical protein [Dyella sp. C9]|uniref:hypothetical protein n=1 Tax=Dyella sp. C9 TaxID=2202154 RepID=UPI000DF00D90|nr:hypothetical protein [Dyella sp. C9]
MPPTWDSTLPLDLPDQRPSPPARKQHSNYLLAHWRGELSLAQSYWCNGVLVGFGMRMLQAGLLAWLGQAHLSLTRLLVVTACYAVIRLVVSIWQVIGILRAAALSDSRWAIVVNVLMVFAVLATLGSLPVEWAALQKLASGASAQRRFDPYTVAPDADGRAIVAKGPIGIGYADAVIEAFTTHASIRRLVLDSVGGDVDNGMQLHDFLAAHRDIEVEVDHVCASACTLAFIGGATRIGSIHSTFGFHQMRSLIDTRYSHDYVDRVQEKYVSLLEQLGASQDFIHLALAKQGDDVYVPNADEMFANHIITGLRIDDRVLSAGQWRQEQFLYALHAQPYARRMGDAMALVRQQWPPIYQAWVERDLRLLDAPDGTASHLSYGVSLWTALHEARRAAMRTVTTDHVRAFAVARRDLLQMISTRLSPDACGRYLDGQAFDPGKLSDPIFTANGDSYANLLTDNDPQRRITVDWSLGAQGLARARSAAARSAPVQPGPDFHAQSCRQQITLIETLLGLPPLDSDMALRSLFSQLR